MTEINDLSQVDALASGDQFPIWQSASGQARRVSADQMADYVAARSVASLAVASLPDPAGVSGKRGFVNNSTVQYNSAAVGAIVSGGGSYFVPVYCDGTNWRIG